MSVCLFTQLQTLFVFLFLYFDCNAFAEGFLGLEPKAHKASHFQTLSMSISLEIPVATRRLALPQQKRY